MINAKKKNKAGKENESDIFEYRNTLGKVVREDFSHEILFD